MKELERRERYFIFVLTGCVSSGDDILYCTAVLRSSSSEDGLILFPNVDFTWLRNILYVASEKSCVVDFNVSPPSEAARLNCVPIQGAKGKWNRERIKSKSKGHERE